MARRNVCGRTNAFLGALCITAAVAVLAPAARAQYKPTALPADLNQASMRVAALNTLYEFDLSPAQLKTLATSTSAAGITSAQTRAPVKANADLSKALNDFQMGLLTSKDDAAIARLRNKVTELTSDAELDDDVQPTAAAIAQAASVRRQLKASQIAAFLASHADQVVDPQEMLIGSVDAVHDAQSEGGANAATEAGTLTAEAATSIAYLVCGTDDAKARALSDQVTAWIKTNAALPEKEFNAQQAAREESAKKLIGDNDPMQVLSRWLDLQIAQLLSNPELPAAINATLAAKPPQK